MGISDCLAGLRANIGHDLLMLPGAGGAAIPLDDYERLRIETTPHGGAQSWFAPAGSTPAALPDRPDRRVYDLTPAGRERVAAWLTEVTWPKQDITEFHLKLPPGSPTRWAWSTRNGAR